MIVISAGLQKSGSGLFFNLTNDILQARGEEDIRRIRQQFGLEELIEFYNCNLENLSWQKLKPLLFLHFKGKRFVVKTHAPPTALSRWLRRLGIAKTTFIYRDPRDVVLSAMAHGKKILAKGETHTFAVCTSIEKTIPMVCQWLDSCVLPWIRDRSTLTVKYEDLITEPVREMKRLAEFLTLEIGDPELENIFRQYEPHRLDDFQKNYLHFNQGTAGNFRQSMNSQELEMCNRRFANHLKIMGYSIQ